MIFFLVNPKIWVLLAALFLFALARRQWRSWRARRRARLVDGAPGRSRRAWSRPAQGSKRP